MELLQRHPPCVLNLGGTQPQLLRLRGQARDDINVIDPKRQVVLVAEGEEGVERGFDPGFLLHFPDGGGAEFFAGLFVVVWVGWWWWVGEKKKGREGG